MQEDQFPKPTLDYEPPQPPTQSTASTVIGALGGALIGFGLPLVSAFGAFVLTYGTGRNETAVLVAVVAADLAILGTLIYVGYRQNKAFMSGVIVGAGIALLIFGGCALKAL